MTLQPCWTVEMKMKTSSAPSGCRVTSEQAPASVRVTIQIKNQHTVTFPVSLHLSQRRLVAVKRSIRCPGSAQGLVLPRCLGMSYLIFSPSRVITSDSVTSASWGQTTWDFIKVAMETVRKIFRHQSIRLCCDLFSWLTWQMGMVENYFWKLP